MDHREKYETVGQDTIQRSAAPHILCSVEARYFVLAQLV
jgi:hypothetical protein